MKKTLVIGAILLLAVAMPLFAQGPFADVPTDHWAYDAVNELQQAGIIIGYPDGTFGGKRPMTRYEFAVAIARAIPVLVERIGTGGGPGQVGPQGPQGPAGPQGPKGEPADVSNFVTQDQFKAFQALVNQFGDELKSLGVDVDALKKDVAALAARVDAIEREQRRVKWNGFLTAFAVATSVNTGAPVDRDNRGFEPIGPASGKFINSISAVRDMDLKLTGSLNPSVAAVADINFGNYVPSYLGGIVNDYVGTVRPTSGTTDEFLPYYTYIQAGLGKGSFSVGRMPFQLTPYTLMLIDVDSYTVNDKTDSGDYPLDGAKLNWNFGGVGLSAFAAKTNQNSVLGTTGLVSQPTAGLYTDGSFITNNAGTAAVVGLENHGAGGLATLNQMGGGRLTVGTPFKGNLGLTYFQAAAPFVLTGYNAVDVYGADFNATFASVPVALNAAQTRIKGEGVTRIDENCTALDGMLGVNLGKLGIDLGYKDIGNNFAAPGFWDKIGRWTNPVNVKGPYAKIMYPVLPSLNFVANGEFLKGRRDISAANVDSVMDSEDDEMWKAEGGFKWGLSAANSVNLGIEYIRWEPEASTRTTEQYINIGVAHQFNPSTGVNIGYQIVDYKPGTGDVPYGTVRSKGSVAVAQFFTRF